MRLDSSKAGAAAERLPSAGRNTAIDSLRTAMMCVVMFGHPLLPYTTVPRRFQEPQAHVAFDVLGVFLYGFAMPAFFVTAGFAAAALYSKRGTAAFWRNRATRIFHNPSANKKSELGRPPQRPALSDPAYTEKSF